MQSEDTKLKNNHFLKRLYVKSTYLLLMQYSVQHNCNFIYSKFVTAAGNTEAVLTPFGILKISGQDQRLRLYSLFPGIELEKAVLETGFPLKLHESYEPFPEITEDEASLLQTLDSEGFRYREFE